MDARSRWSEGLTWGGCAWLVYVALRSTSSALVPFLGRPSLRFLVAWPSSAAPWMSVVWFTAVLSIAVGSRWSRAVVGAAISAQIVLGVTEASRYGGPVSWSFLLRFFLPMSLPLLPLLVLRVEAPRISLALLALGRWREAMARSGGWRAALVAGALISLNHSTCAVLLDVYQGMGADALVELALPAALFALAAVAIYRARRVTSAPASPA